MSATVRGACPLDCPDTCSWEIDVEDGRKGEGRFERISWDDALGTVAERLRQTIDCHGPQSVLPYFSGGTLGKWPKGSTSRTNVNATTNERDTDLGGGFHDNRVEVTLAR